MEGVSLLLIGEEYFLGAAHNFMKNMTVSNDRGEYSFGYVEPGRAYVLLAEKRAVEWAAKSDVPLDPKLRRPALAPTYYPNARSIDGAVAFMLRPGEAQEGIDLKMARTPSLCLEAVTLAAGAPAALNFQLDEQEPVIGSFSGGGIFLNPAKGVSDKDGRIRLCDLHSAQYRLTLQSDLDQTTAPSLFGITTVTVGDRDVRDVRAMALPGFAIGGEVAWEGAPLEKPVNAPVTLSLMPLTRGRWMGEAEPPKVYVPGTFTFERVLADTYEFTAKVNYPGMYVKDIVAGGRSVLYQPIDAANVGSGGIRIVVARDTGALRAHVADKDGNPIGDATVYVMPVSAGSEGALSTSLSSGTTDQNGDFGTTEPLPAGKYLVLASQTPASVVAERIERLWQSRSKAQEVEIRTGAWAQVTLELVNLEEHR